MITARTRFVAPFDPVVTLAEMQVHLRLDLTGSPPSHPEDALIQQKVAAATSDIDAGEGWLGRALMPQRWRVSFDGFPCSSNRNPDGALFLPYPPLISVDAVYHRDAGGALVGLTEGTHYTVNTDGDPHGFIRAPYLTPWPVAAGLRDALTVEFTCGYDASGSPANPLPDTLKQYVMIVAASMYEQREADSFNINVMPIRQFRDAIQTFRVYGP